MNIQAVHKHNIKAVILAGSRDFGRCPIASRLPVSLWPVLGRPAFERVVRSVSAQGIRDICVCSEEGIEPFKSLMVNIPGLRLRYFEEPSRVGTAGCVRDAIDNGEDEIIVVLTAAIVCPPDVNELVCAHIEQKSNLTAAFCPGREGALPGSSMDIYVCDRTVLGHIPEAGYCDIKEWLIPEMVRAGKVVKAHKIRQIVGNFRNAQGYLRVLADYLKKEPPLKEELPSLFRKSEQLWIDETAKIDSAARFFGPVVVMEHAMVAKRAAVFGPTVIGRGVCIGEDSLIVGSTIWDNSKVGRGCEIQRCLIDFERIVHDNVVLSDVSVARRHKNTSGDIVERVFNAKCPAGSHTVSKTNHKHGRVSGGLAGAITSNKGIWQWIAVGLISAAFLWSYWPGIVDLWNVWQRSDEYSSGLLVPFLAVYILWSRRLQITGIQIRPFLWGLLAFVVAQAVRFFGLFFMYGSAERLSVVLSIAALVLLLFGWEFFRKVFPILLFLFLMLPWPNRIQTAVTLPLQRWATSSAVFCLEVIGYEVTSEGNIIHIGQVSIAIAEACNGLRMVTAFFVISGLVVLLVERAWWEKLIVFVSGLPIALFCNTVRLALTAIAFTALGGEYWEKFFHDFGGYTMIPLALGIVVGELWFLAKLTAAPKEEATVVIQSAKLPIGTANRAEGRNDI